MANRGRKRTVQLGNRDKPGQWLRLHPEPSVSGPLARTRSPKTPRNRVFFRVDRRCAVKVSTSADSMAERVGFEPTVPFQVHLISNQARSTGLRHLSERAEASRIPCIRATPGAIGLNVGSSTARMGLIRRSGALVLACAHLEVGTPGARRLDGPSDGFSATRRRDVDPGPTMMFGPDRTSEGSIRFGAR